MIQQISESDDQISDRKTSNSILIMKVNSSRSGVQIRLIVVYFLLSISIYFSTLFSKKFVPVTVYLNYVSNESLARESKANI